MKLARPRRSSGTAHSGLAFKCRVHPEQPVKAATTEDRARLQARDFELHWNYASAHFNTAAFIAQLSAHWREGHQTQCCQRTLRLPHGRSVPVASLPGDYDFFIILLAFKSTGFEYPVLVQQVVPCSRHYRGNDLA